MPKVARYLAICFCIALFCAIVAPKANADEWNKKTILTFSGPVQVGKTQLDAGTYVFKLADTYDRNIVQIFNQDENHLIATIMATPDFRLEPTDKTVIKFSETADGQTASGTLPEGGVPIKEWFYPGDNFGQEFKVVPQPVETAALEPPASPAEAEESEATPEPEAAPAPEAAAPEAQQPAETPEPETSAQPQTPEQSAQPATTPNEEQGETKLPKTASTAPLIALVSVLSFGIAFGLRALGKRVN